jgi:hypothetical protein
MGFKVADCGRWNKSTAKGMSNAQTSDQSSIPIKKPSISKLFKL